MKNERQTGNRGRGAGRTPRSKKWTELSGDCMIFAREVAGPKGVFVAYSTSLGVKNEHGRWENFYIDVRFCRGQQPEPDTDKGVKINILEGFLTFNVAAEADARRPYIMVLDYEECDY